MEHCVNHSEVTADYICEWCEKFLCRDCVQFSELMSEEIGACPCGGRAIPVQFDFPEKDQHSSQYIPPENVSLADSFFYAFRGNGPWILGGTVGFITLMEFVRFPVWLFLGGYLLAYGKKMILYSADGEREMPGWPDFMTIADDIVRPLFLWLFCLVLCFGPMSYFLHSSYSNLFLAIFFGLLGAAYFPICILSVSMHDSILPGLNAHLLIPGIIKIGVDYLLVSLLMMGAIGLMTFLPVVFGFIPLIGILISRFIGFYLFITLVNMIGLVYFKHESKLEWFS